ncbi:hypothetical protein FV226_26190 [Methylobacterium sp. WL12]|uniref:hypothetical protein n=1 Tax=Methylobacterium sp. WL12 TaxID=2603890 RepID=UPI0011C8EFB8|nr:hypothetical protein [Methylobacterium sp. WL12]TXM64693.1 hypothetical protein FV226_26190 [Methylobacterium sp. WL12]
MRWILRPTLTTGFVILAVSTAQAGECSTIDTSAKASRCQGRAIHKGTGTESRSPAGTAIWKRYTNARTGASAEYPAHLVADAAITDLTDGRGGAASRPPTGIRFSAASGIEIAIYGVEGLRTTPYAHLCGDRCEGETYSAKRPNVAVVSGRRASFIYYRRCKVGKPGTLHCFDLEYPHDRAAEFGAIVSRMTVGLE